MYAVNTFFIVSALMATVAISLSGAGTVAAVDCPADPRDMGVMVPLYVDPEDLDLIDRVAGGVLLMMTMHGAGARGERKEGEARPASLFWPLRGAGSSGRRPFLRSQPEAGIASELKRRGLAAESAGAGGGKGGRRRCCAAEPATPGGTSSYGSSGDAWLRKARKVRGGLSRT